jgi:iron complex outermembrane receptor protein
MMGIRRISLFVASLACSAAAFAAAAEEGPAAPSAATAESSDVLQTVVVTAQHRTEASQDVPIAMQVVTAQQVQKLQATDLAKMDGYIPGLSVSDEQPTQPGYTLRGISISDFGIGTDAPIGIYEDGVYTGKTGGALLLFNDVQRVEVLKGPQGTLFGRNSAAGAISVATNAPTDELAAGATVRFGNYGTRYVDAMVNAPLTDALDARVSFVDNQSNGWLHDAATGVAYDRNGDWGSRAQLLWKAPADTQVRLSWEHEELDQPARPAIGIVPLPPAPGLPPYPADPNTWINPLTAPVYNDVVDGRETRKFDGINLRVEHSFAFGDFTSISAWRHFNTFNREDQDGTNRINLYFDDANIEQNTTYSQEFTLHGKSGPADWVLGASYFYEDAAQQSQLNLYTDSIDTLINNTVPGLAGGVYGPISAVSQPLTGISLLGDTWQETMYNHLYARAAAVYGDVIWHLGPQWNLTTGLRFTDDHKDFSWYNPTRLAPQLDTSLAQLSGAGFPLPPFPYTQNVVFNYPVSLTAPYRLNNSWTDVSPRAVLDYKPSEAALLYLSYSRGYEAGGYNALQPGATYNPEYVSNYELGVKSELLDHRLLLNASVYYYLYTHLQNLNLVTNGSVIPQYEVTTSDQHATGVDFETRWQATDALSLRLLAAYINQTYASYITPDGINLAGQAVGTPLWSVAGGFDYLWRDVASGDVDFTLQGAYGGPTRCNADSANQGSCLTIPAFQIGTSSTRADARLAWTSHGRAPVTVAVYGNNLTNKQYVEGVNNLTATTLGTPFTNITAPRFYGVELGVRY